MILHSDSTYSVLVNVVFQSDKAQFYLQGRIFSASKCVLNLMVKPERTTFLSLYGEHICKPFTV